LLALAVAGLVVSMPVSAQVGTSVSDPVDYDAIYRLKDEGFQRSQVMDIASYLTDVYGPRLTGSPNIRRAADWTVKKLAEWGATNPRIEEWGRFGRGWVNERYSANVISPQPWPILGVPKAWTPGTSGIVMAEAIYAPMDSEKDFETWKGKLKGKIVLARPIRDVEPDFEPLAKRYADKDLQELESLDPKGDERHYDMSRLTLLRKIIAFLADEEVAAVFEPGRGDGGTLFVQQGGAYNPGQPVTGPYAIAWPANAPTQIVLAVEHYGRIARILQKKLPVSVELNVQNKFYEDQQGFNVIAELPGTDKADEIVMLGGHFDSWHGATGATDNGAGSAIMIEALRILKASGVKMRRTVRLALWSGEEQGLLGSKAYVKNHLADRETMQVKPEHGKISAYFNVDNGTGAIRGVYLQRNEAVRPIFTAWMKPFDNLGMATLTLKNTSGTDHLSFDAVGIPAFQFIQDPVEYETRTHHSNMDNYERLQDSDMIKNAVIVASFVYHTANRDAMLPRKPLPKAEPEQRPRTVPTTTQ
jgi:carboxypeptidase Q